MGTSVGTRREGIALLLTLAWVVGAVAEAPTKVTYEDHIKPIFRNHCAKCHNPEEKNSDLDVMTFSSLIAGGASGQVVTGGDPDSSRLFKLVAHTEEPKMPPESAKIPDAEVELLKAWIAGGLLEKSDSKAMLSAKPKAQIALSGASVDKPTGPAAMPADLLLEPVIRLPRGFAVTAIATSPWAPVLAIAAPQQVLLYHSETLELLGILPFREGMPRVLKFSRSGSLLLVGGGRDGQSGIAVLFDVSTGERILKVGEEYDAVLAADISSDQQMIALGGPGKLVHIYSTKTGELIRSIKKHTDWVTALEFSPDAVLLASGDRAGGLHVWEAYSGQPFYTLNGHKGAVTDVSWRADSNVVASASEDHTVWLWEMFNGTAVKNWAADAAGVLSVEFAKDGRIVTAGRERVAKLWDGNGAAVRSYEEFGDLMTSVSFNHDATRVIGGDWTGEIRVWKGDDGARLGTLAMNPPTLAERITTVDAELPNLVAQVEKLSAESATLQTTLQSVQQAADAAKQTLAAAQIADQQADAKLAEVRTAIDATTKAHGAAQADLEAKRADAKAKTEAVVVEKAALEQAKGQLAAADQAIAAQSKLIEQLTLVAAEARKVAGDGTLNKERIEQAAGVIDQALGMSKEVLASSQAVQSVKTTEVAERTTKSQAMEKVAAEASNLVPVAEKAFGDAAAALQAAQILLPEVEKTSVAAKAKVAEVTPVAQKADEALVQATNAATQAKGAADAAVAAVTKAKTDRRKWEIGQVRVTLYAAKEVVAEKEQKLAEISAKAAEAKQPVDAAAAEVTTAETFVAEGPAKIEAGKVAITQAQGAIDAANAELEMAKGVLAKKEALRGDSESQMASVKAASEGEPENEALKGALAKANESLLLLVADRDQAIKLVESKQAVVQQAIDAKAAAEQALVDLEKKIADMPATITALKAKLAEVTAPFSERQKEVDAASAEVEAAKAQVEQINGQIAALAAQPVG